MEAPTNRLRRPFRETHRPGRGAVPAAACMLLVSLVGCAGQSRPATTAGEGRRSQSQQQIAASYLGTSRQHLRELTSLGLAPGAIAAATPGRSSAGLLAALAATDRKALEAQHVTPATIAKRLAALKSRARAWLDRTRRQGSDLDLAASYLGITSRELSARLATDGTLARVAESITGRSARGLEAALIAGHERVLRDAVRRGQLSEAEERSALKALRRRIARELTLRLG